MTRRSGVVRQPEGSGAYWSHPVRGTAINPASQLPGQPPRILKGRLIGRTSGGRVVGSTSSSGGVRDDRRGRDMRAHDIDVEAISDSCLVVIDTESLGPVLTVNTATPRSASPSLNFREPL